MRPAVKASGTEIKRRDDVALGRLEGRTTKHPNPATRTRVARYVCQNPISRKRRQRPSRYAAADGPLAPRTMRIATPYVSASGIRVREAVADPTVDLESWMCGGR